MIRKKNSPWKRRGEIPGTSGLPLDELIQSWLRMETLQTLHRTRSTHGLMRIFEDKYSP